MSSVSWDDFIQNIKMALRSLLDIADPRSEPNPPQPIELNCTISTQQLFCQLDKIPTGDSIIYSLTGFDSNSFFWILFGTFFIVFVLIWLLTLFAVCSRKKMMPMKLSVEEEHFTNQFIVYFLKNLSGALIYGTCSYLFQLKCYSLTSAFILLAGLRSHYKMINRLIFGGLLFETIYMPNTEVNKMITACTTNEFYLNRKSSLLDFDLNLYWKVTQFDDNHVERQGESERNKTLSKNFDLLDNICERFAKISAAYRKERDFSEIRTVDNYVEFLSYEIRNTLKEFRRDNGGELMFQSFDLDKMNCYSQCVITGGMRDTDAFRTEILTFERLRNIEIMQGDRQYSRDLDGVLHPRYFESTRSKESVPSSNDQNSAIDNPPDNISVHNDGSG